ncbi:MAG: division/cell wall cluster transcriptional repressor MraZ [Lachnospiraceae bacterium]|jgi:MraZ protein|nr:division/cell wall cluster transcriptional repressor MraZ [Lachnospiraceae bacterium]
MLYLGRYNNSIDSKGRVVIPAKFREKLGEVFVVCGGFDKSLYVYDMADFEEYAARLKELPRSDERARRFKQFFLTTATDVEPDKQGRVSIGEDLIRYAEIKKDVVVVGNGDHIEIWARERFPEADSYGDIGELASGLSEYGLLI